VEEHGPHVTAMEEAITPGTSSSGAPTMGWRHLYESLDALKHPHARRMMSFSRVYLIEHLSLNCLSHSLAYTSLCKNRQPVCLPCLFSNLSFTGSLQAEDTPRGAAAEKNSVPRSKGVEKDTV